jgi:hypothetical protein
MKKGTAIFLIVSAIGLAAIAGASLKELKRMADHPQYKIVRDTVYIDRGRSDCQPWYQYQVELGRDSTYLWNNQRLVAVMHYSNSNIDSVLLKDNE